ncbi:uncharacterized protein LOC121741472 [Salvia splendens]|uniref:uncharacterized protein LOC121741472 n=1 Tax=Salvia splendens TaxID=180675 RepID=UPI001C278D1D|nr:uncharacterized protein LOC121741472 [Salvia splendens]
MDELERRRLLHHPLLSPSTTAASSPLGDDDNIKLVSSNSAIFSRLFLVAIIAAVSVWANREASKGFAITVANESADAFLASRFKLFYVSNDGAARAAIKASDSIEKLLFPDSDVFKKPIKSIEIRLVDRNFTDNVAAAEMDGDRDRFAISVSSSVMRGADFDREMAPAIRRGVARVWLWDGGGHAPRSVVSGIVEYLVDRLGDSAIGDAAEEFEAAAACLDSGNPRSVAELLRRSPGSVGRLNRAMKEGWSDEKLGGALGLPVEKLCATSDYESLRYKSSSV